MPADRSPAPENPVRCFFTMAIYPGLPRPKDEPKLEFAMAYKITLHSICRPAPLSVPQAEESLNHRKPIPWSTATCLTSWAQNFLDCQRRCELIGSPFSQTLIVPRRTSVMCQPKIFLQNVRPVKSGQLLRAERGWSPVVSGRFITNFLSKRLEVSPNLIAECQGW